MESQPFTALKKPMSERWNIGVNPGGKAGLFIKKDFTKNEKDLRKDILLLSPKA